jgi:2-hydroxychromene-2-carboxylate isomerase
VVGGILEALGRPGAAWLERAAAPRNKQALRAQTDEARGLGIFGAPTAVVAGELFWGNDRLEEALGRAAGIPGWTAPGGVG